ncbi:hypothetical protein HPULCUR_005756 [Helicostylum pulchrum]|uniref:Uncharacterized protein n=1 Tax=Helicostylum pulchrum TaxID=562976 RepID=A0ABP9XZZ6_9FUNG
MWNNIVEDNSLIQLCDTHREYNENGPLKIFTLENQVEFTNNLKQYISENNLCQLPNDKYIVQLSVSCNCKVCLMVNDIVEISFRHVLQDITSLLSASLINKEFFGKYWNIRYVFQLIHFNYNTQLQDAVMKMIKEINEDIMIEQEIDIPHYVIPKMLDQRLQPVYQQRLFLYKEFRIGALYHGDKIDDCQTSRIYLNLKNTCDNRGLTIIYVKLKTLDSLKPDGTIALENISEDAGGLHVYGPEKDFKENQDIPVVISIVYEADLSSLSFTAKLVGEEAYCDSLSNHAQPMTLDRF